MQLSDLRSQLRDRINEQTAAAWTDAELDTWINEGVRDISIRTECNMYRSEVIVPNDVYLIQFPPISAQYYTISETGSVTGTQSSTDIDAIRVSRCSWVDDESPDFSTVPTGGTLSIASAAVSDPFLNNYDDEYQNNEYPLKYRGIQTMDSMKGSGQQIHEGVPSFYSTWGQSGNIKLVLYPKPTTTGHLRIYFYGIPPKMTNDTDEDGLPRGWEHLILAYAQYRAQMRDGDQMWQAAKGEYESLIGEFEAQFKRLTDANEPLFTDAFWHGMDDFGYDGGGY